MILILLIAGLLILAVMLQNSKKEGLGNAYLGSDTGASQLVGVQKTSDLLEQITWGLVIALFIFTLLATLYLRKTDQSVRHMSPNINRVQEQGVLPEPTTE